MSERRTDSTKRRLGETTAKQPAARWQLQTARARFSEVFRRARSEGPQWITRQDREAVVMLPAEEFAAPYGTCQAASKPRQVLCRIASGKGANRSGTDARLRSDG